MEKFVRERGSYGFGRFRMDAARRTLTRDGAAVALTPTLFDTLLYLVENPARVVTKEELLAAVWPGRFVEESNLTQTIFMLRKALRDAGDDGRLIVTTPGRGYRFAAEARPIAETASPDAARVEAEPLPETDEERSGDPEAVDVPGADAATGRPRSQIDRRNALLGGALAVAAVGAGGWVWWRGHEGSAAADQSIVVLPFANLSGDADQAYFSDGITEEVRDALATIRGLRVTGRVSSAQVRDMSSRDIGAKLGVSAIVTGSVRRSPTSIRVSAQLIDAARGDERWSQNYDRAPGDVIAVEYSIAKGVAGELEARIGANETVVGTSDPQAHDLYLKAAALAWEHTDEETPGRALALIDAALQIDPRYAKAHFARAEWLGILAQLSENMADQHRLFAEQEQSVRRGLALAPEWSQSHSELGDALCAQFDFKGALAQYEKAQRLDPDHINTRPCFMLAMSRWDWARAVAAQEAIVSRDPLNPGAWEDLSFTFYQARRYEKSIAVCKQVLAWAPEQLEANFGVALALLCLGRSREALDAVSMLSNDGKFRPAIQAIANWQLGDRRASDEALARLKRHVHTANYRIAMVLAQRGEVEAALGSLNDAWRFRDFGFWALPIEPMLDPLRNEPKFRALLTKLGFP